MHVTFRRFFIGCCLLQLVSFEVFSYGKQSFSRISLQHREHKGVGFNDGYSTLGCFLSPRVTPLAASFFDARLHVFNDAYLASNVGAGARFASRDQSYMIGLNAYYDYRNYRSLSSHQLASGIEILSRRVDVRINGYYPFSGMYQDYPFLFGGFKEHAMMIRQKVLYALPSADAEVGFTLPDPFDQIGLYVGVGGYYLFKQRGFNKTVGNVPGGKIRLTATPTKYLSFGVDYTYDKLFRGRANGFVSLNIPIGLRRLRSAQGNTTQGKNWIGMQTQPVVRSEIIPFIQKQHRFMQLNREGEPLHFVFVNHKKLSSAGSEAGQGTFESPYTTLATAQKNSSPGDYIYVFFGNGTSQGYDQGFQFQANQTLLSSGASLTLGNVEIPALTPGLLPLIAKSQGAVIEAVSASQVAMHGFRVEASEGEAMYVENTALTLGHNELKGSSNFSVLKVKEAVGQNHVYENSFYGLGASDAAMIQIAQQQDMQDVSYTIYKNQIIALESQDGLLLDDVRDALVSHNAFIGADPTGVALICRASDGGDLQHRYQYNTITSGFYKAMDINIGHLEHEEMALTHNDFSSGTLVSGIVYHSDAEQAYLSVIDNKIESLADCLILESSATGKARIEVSDNELYCYTGSPCIALSSSASVEAMLASNTIAYAKNLKGTFAGIECSLTAGTSELAIVNNHIQMNSANDGIVVISENEATLHVEMTSNEVVSKGNTKGIKINNLGSGLLMLKVFDEKEAAQFTLSNLGSGTFEVETSSKEGLQYKGEVSFIETSPETDS